MCLYTVVSISSTIICMRALPILSTGGRSNIIKT